MTIPNDASAPRPSRRPAPRWTADQQIAASLVARLIADERTRDEPIDVEVQNRVVILTGHVDRPDAAFAAGYLAWRTQASPTSATPSKLPRTSGGAARPASRGLGPRTWQWRSGISASPGEPPAAAVSGGSGGPALTRTRAKSGLIRELVSRRADRHATRSLINAAMGEESAG